MINLTPRVSVVMPVYNGEKYIQDAINSILNQTFADFELLIIDDGSTDGSVSVVKSYQDPRIKLIKNKRNLGLSETRNRGIKESQSEYIAWLDCDDISTPTRLEKQVNFLENNLEIGLCGTWIRKFGDKNIEVRYPLEHDLLRSLLFFKNPIATSSVLVRRNIIQNNNLFFNSAFDPAEDYHFWERLSRNTKIANIPEFLTLHRIHHEQVSRANGGKLSSENAIRRINIMQLEYLGLQHCKEEEYVIFENFRSRMQASKVTDLYNIIQLLNKIRFANKKTCAYPEPYFSKLLAKDFFLICYKSSHLGVTTWKTFHRSDLNYFMNNDIRKKIVFAINCIMSRKKISSLKPFHEK